MTYQPTPGDDAVLVALAALVFHEAAAMMAWTTGKFPGDPARSMAAIELESRLRARNTLP